jgi:hypothetical protein
MTRFRKAAHVTGRDNWPSLLAVGFTSLFVLCLLVVPSAWAASPAGRTSPTQGVIVGPTAPQSAPSPITPYVAQGYSIVGPLDVVSASSSGIVVFMDGTNQSIDLTGKAVTVIDQNSRSTSLSAAVKGTRVYVCRKANNVVVVVIPAVTTTGGAKK